MFGRNEKTVKKLEKFCRFAEYDTSSKLFKIILNHLTAKHVKEINKFGLKIHTISRTDQADKYYDDMIIYLKCKSKKTGIIIWVLSIQVILFGLQMLYLAFKTTLP